MRLLPICLLHALLLAWAFSPTDDLWSGPIRNVDYTMHFYTARHIAERFVRSGLVWGYDPGWMAGFPDGMLALVDNKLFGAILLLAPQGREAAVFNAAIVLALLSFPVILYGAARSAGSSRAEARGTALAAIALLYGAPLTVLFWAAGGISFLLASVLVVSAAFLWTGSGARRGVLAATVAVVAVFVHPLALLPLAAALAPGAWHRSYEARLRSFLGLAGLGCLLGLTLLPVAAGVEANISHVRPLPRAGGNYPGGIGALVADWWTFFLRTPGYEAREYGFFGAGSLAAVALLAVYGLVQHGPDSRRVPRHAAISAMVACALLAYLASTVSFRFVPLQPHRFIIPLGFFSAVPAGWGLVRLLAALRERRSAAWIFALLLVAILAESTWTLRRRNLASGVDPAEAGVADFLRSEANDDGRVLIETGYIMVPAAPASSRRIGMFRFTLLPLDHSREFIGTDHMATILAERYATFHGGRLFDRLVTRVDRLTLRELLDRYAVSTVIACADESRGHLDGFPEMLVPTRDFADCRGYRVRDAVTSRLLEGHGEVRARLDRIEVREARGERLVLKYHWIPALATEPPLPIEEAPQPGAPVGFIAVRPGRTRDFDVVVAPPSAVETVWRGFVRRAFGR